MLKKILGLTTLSFLVCFSALASGQQTLYYQPLGAMSKCRIQAQGGCNKAFLYAQWNSQPLGNGSCTKWKDITGDCSSQCIDDQHMDTGGIKGPNCVCYKQFSPTPQVTADSGCTTLTSYGFTIKPDCQPQ